MSEAALTKGLKDMSVTVHVEDPDDIDRAIRWVNSFELIAACGSWRGHGFDTGEASFFAVDVEQYQRLVGYVAAWEGE